LETSKGNYQYGFLLKNWTDDIHAGDELFAGLVDAKLQDEGVRTCCRLFRLPGSVNDKPGRDGFRAVLTHCDENIVYTLKSLTKALQVTPGKVAKVAAIDPNAPPPNAGMTDPVFVWLVEQGHILHEATGGWWEVRCPWPEEHTNPNPGTRFMPLGSSQNGLSNVMCQHGHGKDTSEFSRRFFDWVVEQGGPRAEAVAAPVIDEGVRSVLRKVAQAMAPRKEVRKKDTPKAAASGPLFTFQTLADALGAIPLSAFPRTDKVKGGYSKIQPMTYANVEAGLAVLGVQARLNLMLGKTSFVLPEAIDMARFGNKTGREIDGMIDAALCDIFHAAGLRNKKELRDNMARIADSLYWHPMRDWVLSKPWDGQDRFEAIAATLPTPTPDLLRAYLRRWLLQTIEATCGWTVRRESQKGLVLVLVGDQRIGKSRWLMSLAPGFGRMGKNLNLNGSNARDSKHESLQAAITELGELDATFRKTDISALKAFITEDTDEYRLPYAPDWMTRPRCTSFCGSVNGDQFLNDPTGSGRFLTIKVEGRPEVSHGIDTQQLWAQIFTWWEAGEQWWLTEAEEDVQIESNDEFQSVDGITEQIGEQIERRKDHAAFPVECGLTQSNVARLMGLRIEQAGLVARVGEGLRKHMGDHKNMRKRGGGPKVWPWWLTHSEAQELGFSSLRPHIPKPDA
jgi:hypothetical protein